MSKKAIRAHTHMNFEDKNQNGMKRKYGAAITKNKYVKCKFIANERASARDDGAKS